MDMASSPLTPTSSTQPQSEPKLQPRIPNLHNPLPLSAAQESQVRDIYYRNVRAKCAAEIKEFASCARSRTVTATWLCRSQRLAMNSCMMIHANREEEDRAREEWFNGAEERRKKKEAEMIEVEKRREEVIRLMRVQEDKERKIQQERETVTGESVKDRKGRWGR